MQEQIHILVIDDDRLDRAAVRRALMSSDLSVNILEAEDAVAASLALQQRGFDCILLDYRLPGSDGLEVLRALRAAGTSTPVIVLTGQGDEQVAVEVMKAGATDYLAKGRLAADTLASSVRHALRLHRAEMQAEEDRALRQQAELALRQNERLLAITLKSIGDAVIATDATGQVIFMNSVAELLTDWTAQAASGQPLEHVLPLLHGQALSALPSPTAQVLSAGATIELGGDVLAQTRAGQRFPIAGTGAPIRDDAGTMVGVVVVFHDMTERVRTEERLRIMAEVSRVLSSSLDYRESLSQLAHLLIPEFSDLCTIDVRRADGSIERMAVAASARVSPAAALAGRRLTFDPQEPYGPANVIRTAQAEYYPDVSPRIVSQLTDEEREFLNLSGLISWICVPLIVRGEPLGAISLGRTEARAGFAQDDVEFVQELAGRAALAVDNALLYQEAQEAIRTRDAFLSIAAHELKTPLTALLGYIELFQRRFRRNGHGSEHDERMLSVITDQARRLNKMILALFDLSRLQIGQLTLDRAPLDLASLTSSIVSEIQPTLERHSLQLDFTDEQLLTTGDALRLEQVLQNLIHNAIKYSPEGGQIYVRLTRQQSWARISVQDFGIGIPEDSLADIFHRFYRAKNTESYNIGGMGVGLYVARQIVELHGGRIEVQSQEGRGSTFSIWLPLQPQQEPAGPERLP